MAGFLNRLRPQGPTLWLTLCGLLLVGILSTAIDYSHLSTIEMRRANNSGQRAVVDPATGTVSLNSEGAKLGKEFDVGTTAEKLPEAAPEVEKPKPEEKPVAEEAPKVEAPAAAPKEETPAAAPEKEAAAEAAPAPAEAASPQLNGLPTLRTQPLAAPAAAAPGSSLVPAPALEISETVNGLQLPKHGSTDTATASAIYAHHFTRTPKQQLLSILIMNAGMSAQSNGLIFTLPNQVSVAFSPYTRDAAATIGSLRKSGYETWGMLPVMNAHFPQDDPGPLGLVSSLPKEELMRRLQTIMNQTLGAVGMVLPPDETLTAKQPIFANLMNEISSRGLFLLTTNATHTIETVTHDAKLQQGIRRADIILDPTPDEAEIQAKLAGIPAELKKKGELIVVMSARPQSLLLLQHWLQTNPLAEPMVLAPLSAQWLPKEVAKPAPEDAKKPEAAAPEKKPEKPAEKKAESEKKAEPEKKAESK